MGREATGEARIGGRSGPTRILLETDEPIFRGHVKGRVPSTSWVKDGAGAVWAVWRKGRKELNENHIRAGAIAAGLVDVKVARFSATHSALKLVVPRGKRG